MIYTALTNMAMRLAYDAHQGQVDAAGMPYIFHPCSLAEQMDNERRTCIALLHDVVEDTEVTIGQLKQEFPPEVTDAVAALTHNRSEDYFTYVTGIFGNPDAMLVKFADLLHNRNDDRLIGAPDISWSARAKKRSKYEHALEMLDGAMRCWADDARYGPEWKLRGKLLERMG